MAGILGDLLGLGGGSAAPTPGLLDAAGYMDPAQYDRMRQSQSMMGLWAGLLAGGGPSLSPRNFGSALGAGLTGAQQFGSQFDESQQHRSAAQKNLADITAKKQGFELAKEYLKGGVLPAGGTPGSGAPNFGAGSGGARATSSTTANADLPPEARAFLDTVAGPESSGAYNARWPGTTFSGYDDHPRIFAPGPEGPSSAAGRYQIVASTWDGLNQKYNFPDFKPETQDTAAWKLAEDTYRSRTGGDLSAALKEGKLQEVQQMLKGQWGTLNMANYGANLRKYTGGDSGGAATVGAAPALAQVPNYSGALGGPAPAPAILAAPGGNPNAQPAPGAGAALTQQQQNAAAQAQTGRPIFPPGTQFNSRGEAISPDLTATLPGQRSSANIPPAVVQGFARANAGVPGGPVNVRPLAGDAVPAEAGPSFGYGSAGGAISPAALAAAAGGAPVPAVLAAPASPAPAPAPTGALPPAAAPAPAATRPPSGPGEVTVTLPKPPALGEMLPVPAAQPQPLPAAPEIPGIPARPQIPGATPGAAVSPAVAARARQAQGVVLGLSMMGVHVPDFLQKEAGIEIAGRTAAAEAEAKQPIELQNKAFEASLTAAQKRWDALNDQQKATLAHERNMTVHQMDAMYSNIHEQYKSVLDLATAGPKAGAIAAEQYPYEIGKIREAPTSMVIGGREVPMSVAERNRIVRGEPPEQVLGPGVLQMGPQYQTEGEKAAAQARGRLEQEARLQPNIEYNRNLLGEAGKQDAALRVKADAAREALITLDDTREQLRGSGIFSGYGANTKMTLAQVGAAAGWPSEKLVNTQTYLIQAGKQAAAILASGAYGSGSGISERDVKTAERLAAGDVTLDIETIKRVLDLAESSGHRAISTFNDRIASHPDAARLAIPVPPRLVGTTGDGKRVYEFPDGTRQVRQ